MFKRRFDHDLAKEYGTSGLGKRPMHQEWQAFYAGYAKPEGFYGGAWKAIYQYVFVF